LGIFLPDTITTDMALKDFNKKFAMEFSGVRQDSGIPEIFAEKVIKHYEKLGINPKHKTIIFSDALDATKACDIYNKFKNRINCSFGIGTNLTNSFDGITPLSIVIKLDNVNGMPVVKLSDSVGKETGDKNAIKNMKWIVDNQF